MPIANNNPPVTSDSQESRTEALFALLDDADENVAQAVEAKLIETGGSVAPQLRAVMQSNSSSAARHNAERALRGLQEQPLVALRRMIGEAAINGCEPDLECAVTLLSKFGHPEIDSKAIHIELNQISLSIHEEFIRSRSADELGHILAINAVFFENLGFTGAKDDYYDPGCSYIHSVLNGKKGIPVALAIIYMLVAERSGAEVYGVSMPIHFLVYSPVLNIFLDIFNGGVFVSRDDCKEFIEKNGVEFKEHMLERADNLSVILRLMRNLAYSHSRYGDLWESETLMRFHAELLGK